MYDLINKIFDVTLSHKEKIQSLWIHPDGRLEKVYDHTASAIERLRDDLPKYKGSTFTTRKDRSSISLYQEMSSCVRVSSYGSEIAVDIGALVTRKQIMALRALSYQATTYWYKISNPQSVKGLESVGSGDSFREMLDDLRSLELIRESIDESLIDYPQEDMDLTVWNRSSETKEGYLLKKEVKSRILLLLSKYPETDLIGEDIEIHVAGSMCSNQYEEDTDIDVHIVMPKAYFEGKDASKFQKDVFKWFKKNIDEIDGYIGKHPIEVYIQLNPAQEYLSAGLYDVVADKWLKGPLIVSKTFDPYEEYEDVLKEVAEVAEDMDALLGELKRDVIDYGVIRTAVARMSGKEKKKLLDRLRFKLIEIESDVREIAKEKGELVALRKQASQPTTPEQALNDISYAEEWKDKNALFKFINRYHYIRLAKDLEKMLEDEGISSEEVKDIQALLGIS